MTCDKLIIIFNLISPIRLKLFVFELFYLFIFLKYIRIYQRMFVVRDVIML